MNILSQTFKQTNTNLHHESPSPNESDCLKTKASTTTIHSVFFVLFNSVSKHSRAWIQNKCNKTLIVWNVFLCCFLACASFILIESGRISWCRQDMKVVRGEVSDETIGLELSIMRPVRCQSEYAIYYSLMWFGSGPPNLLFKILFSVRD